MKSPIVALILLANFLFAAGQDKIEWSATRKLSVNDFKGPPPDPSTKHLWCWALVRK